MKRLKELQNFNIEFKGDIKESDIKAIIENPQEWAEEFAEKAIMKEMPRYLKAKTLGENFAREIVND